MIEFKHDYRSKMDVFAAGINCCKIEEIDNSGAFMVETMICCHKGEGDMIQDIYSTLLKGQPVPKEKQNKLYSVLSSVMKGKNIVE